MDRRGRAGHHGPMPSRVLPERWPVGVGIAIGALVVLIAAWAVSPALTVAIVGAVVAGVGYLVYVDRRDADGGIGVPAATAELDRLHSAELALAAAPDTEVAARELSKLAMAVLAPPAVVVIIEGIGDAIHMEAGDTAAHPADAPGSRARDLWVDGESRGSITISARPGRAYG